MGAGKSN